MTFIWSNHPKIIEINTLPWLDFLTRKHKTRITLSNIPEEHLLFWQKYFDGIWLMGIWERSPKSKNIALEHKGLIKEYKEVLSDFKAEDVFGSPYSVYDYNVDKSLGGNKGLKDIHIRLREKDLNLILDYIPNHLAVDHKWISQYPEMFIQGTKEDLKKHQYEYFKSNNTILAHGKDPNFPPWTDTVQINAFSKKAREKSIEILDYISNFCEGVRCDMAMLLLNDVFRSTWKNKVEEIPEIDYWEHLIPKIKEQNSEFKFIAEVYWNMEWELQKQGFDYCYDKRLYNRLLHEDPISIKNHLQADLSYQQKLMRFIENHDEKRILDVLGEQKAIAAAFIILTLPGAKLIHEGQMKGYKIKLPVQLKRHPLEEKNESLYTYYLNLLDLISLKTILEGTWKLCDVFSIDSHNNTNINLIAYTWFTNKLRIVLVTNYSQIRSQGHVYIPDLKYNEKKWKFKDLLTQQEFKYEGKNLQNYGLYVDLKPWNSHFFNICRQTKK